MNRYRVTWWQAMGQIREHADFVLAYTAADAVTQVEMAHRGRTFSSEGDAFRGVRSVEPAPLQAWTCACGASWSAPGPASCLACGLPSGPTLTPAEAT